MNTKLCLLLVLVALILSGCVGTIGFDTDEGFVMKPKEDRDETYHTLDQLQHQKR